MNVLRTLLLAFFTIAIAGVCEPAGATQAVPTNFLIGGATDDGAGTLTFDLSWQSSSGNLQDLAQCKVGEYVTYPGGQDPWPWPDPAWTQSTQNPTIILIPGSDGGSYDDQHPGTFDDYILEEVYFTATQSYWYSCPPNGNVVYFPSSQNITLLRDVKQVRPNYHPCARYTITKLGKKATFIPKDIVTCTPQPNDSLFTKRNSSASPQPNRLPLADAQNRSRWRITARPVSDIYSSHEPIYIDLEVTNLGSDPATVDLGGNGKTNLRFTITEPGGLSKVAQLDTGGLKAYGRHVLPAHSQYTERLVLNEWNDFSEVGNYYAKIELAPQFGAKSDAPPTANLHLSIVPRDETKLAAVAKALADQAINDNDFGNRSDAALALSYVTDPIAIPEMARVLSSGSDAGLVLTDALARQGGPEAIKVLKSAQNNHYEWIRYGATRALRALRDGKKPLSSQVAD